MWKLLLICVVMSALNGESSGANRAPPRKRRAYAGGYAGGYASSGGGAGGYTGTYNSGGGGVGHSSFVGTGGGGGGGYYDYDDYDGYSPNFGIIDPYLFHQQLTNHILAQNYANQQAVTGLATSGNAFASADASLVNDNDIRIQQQIAAQQAYHDNLIRQNRYRGGSGSGSGSSSGSYNSHRYAPSYAAASGSIGPNGYRQTAFINPANPASPNIVNRFGGGSGGGSSFSSSSSSGGGSGGGGGYKGVSVSSYSHSNGDGTSRRGAQTTVNDNGKVTSYSVHS
ncbi:ATP-dependent RNA helicase A isoform X1 [Drosophila ficusphila]|uniref:ATP-dependent RNA helicase A isoform X1 n=1 Tax=Drosophila ficusphila TaxID=30025 RepID=UPI0007E6456E|nr:ATP-dependent RNA helicase A isoform X1 [Drosophila ficusphila]XP_017050554.1 ATP-dependent RNA helicase A isoform X1 [Drosophila ficusphila]XP_017050555.1 ATP-dependent RNA helicase A isoform X1 [Drosophila ficusphila]